MRMLVWSFLNTRLEMEFTMLEVFCGEFGMGRNVDMKVCKPV